MIYLTENQTRLMELDNEYYKWYYDNVGKPPSFWDEEYPIGFELLENGKIVAKEFTEEESKRRNKLTEKIDRYNKARDLWIVREAYKRYGYDVAEWMARTRRVEMSKDLYPCHCEQAQCSMFCAKYVKGCRE